METRTKLIIAGAVLALTAGGAIAAEGVRRHFDGEHQRIGKELLERADTDKDGAISSAEMAAVIGARFTQADANSDASVTKAEIVAAVEKQTEFERARRHAGRIADGMVNGFDLDDNGSLALGEIENRTKKMFALADFNDDGKVEPAELRRMRMAGMRHGGMRHGWRGWDRDGDGGPAQ